MSIWDICLLSNAFQLVQYPNNVSTLHVESFLWYGGITFENIHGWFLHLWRFIRSMSSPSRARPPTLCWEKSDIELRECHFMVRQGIILCQEIFKNGIEVDKSKIEVIDKIPVPKCIKDIRSFLGHADFYCKFIKGFNKIARPLTNLLAQDVPFTFDNGCLNTWEKLKMSLFLHQSSLHQIGQSCLKLCAMLQILLYALS